MEKNKFLFTSVTLLLLMTFLLSACKATPTAEPTEPPEVAPTATSAPEATEPPPTEVPPTPDPNAWRERPELESDFQGEIVLWDWSYEPRNLWMEKYIAEWEELRPGVTISYEIFPESDVESKLATALVAGTGPDFSVLNQEWRVEFQRNGLLEALPKDLFPEAWRELLYSTPFLQDENGDIYVTSVGAMGAELFWDKQLFADAGLTEEDVPETWDELTALAQTFTTWNEDGTLDTAGFGINGLPVWIWFDLVVQKGGHFYNEDVTEALWNETAGVEAAQFVRDLFYEYEVTSPNVPWWGDLYCNGKAAMGYSYAWMPGWVAASCPEKSEDLGIAPLPTFDGAPAQGLQLQEDFLGVFADTDPEKKALIWDFIHYLLLEDDDRVVELALDFGVPPDRLDLVDDPSLEESELLQIGAAVAAYSVRPGPLPMFGDHYNFLNTAFEEITLQDVPAQEALDSAVEQANLDLETSGKTYTSTEWKYVPPE